MSQWLIHFNRVPRHWVVLLSCFFKDVECSQRSFMCQWLIHFNRVPPQTWDSNLVRTIPKRLLKKSLILTEVCKNTFHEVYFGDMTFCWTTLVKSGAFVTLNRHRSTHESPQRTSTESHNSLVQPLCPDRMSNFGRRRRWTRIELSRDINIWTDFSRWMRILFCSGRITLWIFRTYPR